MGADHDTFVGRQCFHFELPSHKVKDGEAKLLSDCFLLILHGGYLNLNLAFSDQVGNLKESGRFLAGDTIPNLKMRG